jgi:hypothetical protein
MHKLALARVGNCTTDSIIFDTDDVADQNSVKYLSSLVTIRNLANGMLASTLKVAN